MKVGIVIADGVRQVMFTAENPPEQQALDMIGQVNQTIQLDIRKGAFLDSVPPSAHAYLLSECKGGYLRAFESPKDSLMLVLRDKSPVEVISLRDSDDLRTAYEAAAEVDAAGGDAPHAPAFGLAAWIRSRFAMEKSQTA